ncbi:MAG: hypothetical protein DLM68_05255 [Hyphomicrobiales bacterium]|nr:MAG: hypothetical protein DLM68_05255 [Hyphomicrobiales bacterium]
MAFALAEIKKAISYHKLTIYFQFRLQIVTKPSSRSGKLRAGKLRAAYARNANQRLATGREPLPAQLADAGGPLAALAG